MPVGGPHGRARVLSRCAARLSNEIKPLLVRRDAKRHCYIDDHYVISRKLKLIEITSVAFFNLIMHVAISINSLTGICFFISFNFFLFYSISFYLSKGQLCAALYILVLQFLTHFVKKKWNPRRSYSELSGKAEKKETRFLFLVFIAVEKTHTQYQRSATRTKTLMLLLLDVVEHKTDAEMDFWWYSKTHLSRCLLEETFDKAL